MKKIALLATGLLLTGVGCGQTPNTAPSASPAPVTQNTPVASPTTEQATTTPTSPASSAMPPATASNPSGTTSPTGRVKLFFVAMNDNGKGGKMIGCGDSLIGVENTIEPVGSDPLVAALNALFQVNDDYYGESGLYNSLYGSNLQIKKITTVGGVYTIELTGTVSLGGACDDPRFYNQIMETVQQFPEVKKADVLINNKKLEDLVSEKG